ncbi:MAG: hypothetical protein GY868_14790 [Deltaproteobacteria bacterium]|nr:hypothetical protein [Deltaproteobacteria bacterium]
MIGKDGIRKQLTKRLVEEAMDSDLTHHLGYDKNSLAGKTLVIPATVNLQKLSGMTSARSRLRFPVTLIFLGPMGALVLMQCKLSLSFNAQVQGNENSEKNFNTTIYLNLIYARTVS